MRRLSEDSPAQGPGADRPRNPADPEATDQNLKGAREALERLRRYLKATAPDDPDAEGQRSN